MVTRFWSWLKRKLGRETQDEWVEGHKLLDP
jgi:hypothetical protein